ncbi:MAG: hypothetical protein Q7S14_02300 [bacterium]|nr:hypothetical protein [bacterium]
MAKIKVKNIKNPVATGFGMLAGESSLIKSLLEEHKKERDEDERKYQLHLKRSHKVD